MSTITEYHPIEVTEAPDDLDGVPAANWAYLTEFKVQVNQRPKVTAPVYANGYQQVPVQVIIQAADRNGAIVSLSRNQLWSIKLIDYHSGSYIPNTTHTRDLRFIYNWEPFREEGLGEGDEETVEDSPGVNAQEIYLHTAMTTVATRQIAAEIISPEGVVFRTNTQNPTAGKFDSWVILQGKEPLKYYHYDLIMERHDALSNANWDVDLYYIRFVDAQLSIVHSTHLDVTADYPHLHQPYGPYFRFHIAYGVSGKRKKTYSGFNGEALISFDVNSLPGQATAARITVKGLKYHDNIRREACLCYLNQYGNTARCAIGNTYANDYNMLQLEAHIHG
ncbi:hypothetical protein [Stenotrophomonas bentonitica]|uniref:hypothetical protein n=1 Tax=Stenotrophomonas bentonitica TaxID=1450134 RepID=UPI00345EC8D4